MKKIPTVFVRNPNNLSEVLNERNPECAWVFNGEGTPTRKYDGSAVKIQDGKLYKRYDCKKGRMPPANFESADEPDPITGHWPGWVPVGGGPEDKWFASALWHSTLENGRKQLADGTYEAIGPHFNGNNEKVVADCLVRHGADEIHNLVDISRETIIQFLAMCLYEGLVWHHPDGRMAKIKARDFGIKR